MMSQQEEVCVAIKRDQLYTLIGLSGALADSGEAYLTHTQNPAALTEMTREQKVELIRAGLESGEFSYRGLNPNSPNITNFYPAFYDPVFVPRSDAEKDESLVHLATYVVVISRQTGKFLSYRRGPKGGEAALLGDRSIGFGGHVNIEHYKADPLTLGIIPNIIEELNEELGLDKDMVRGQIEHFYRVPVVSTPAHVGEYENMSPAEQLATNAANPQFMMSNHAIFDMSNDVGMMHLGIPGAIVVDEDTFVGEHGHIEELQWVSLTDLHKNADAYESWSRGLITRFYSVVYHLTKRDEVLIQLASYANAEAKIKRHAAHEVGDEYYSKAAGDSDTPWEALDDMARYYVGLGMMMAMGRDGYLGHLHRAMRASGEYKAIADEVVALHTHIQSNAISQCNTPEAIAAYGIEWREYYASAYQDALERQIRRLEGAEYVNEILTTEGTERALATLSAAIDKLKVQDEPLADEIDESSDGSDLDHLNQVWETHRPIN